MHWGARKEYWTISELLCEWVPFISFLMELICSSHCTGYGWESNGTEGRWLLWQWLVALLPELLEVMWSSRASHLLSHSTVPTPWVCVHAEATGERCVHSPVISLPYLMKQNLRPRFWLARLASHQSPEPFLPSPLRCLSYRHTPLNLDMVLGIWTHVLKLAWQALHQMSHLPAPPCTCSLALIRRFWIKMLLIFLKRRKLSLW